MKNVVVLGAGMVGSAIAADLAGNCRVAVADIDGNRLERLKARFGIDTIVADLSRPEEVRRAVEKCDVTVGAVPGFLG